MKQKVFFDLTHANAYLSDSVIRVGGEPVFVDSIRELKNYEWEMRYWVLGKVGGENKLKTISLKNPEIDMNPVPLGMLATGAESKATCFISRSPRRAWKIGLTTSSMIINDVDKQAKKNIRWGKAAVLYSSSLRNTINDEYLSIKKAYTLSTQEDIPVAFDRNFAVWNNQLFARDLGIPIGSVDKNARVGLKDEFTYLKESLDEALDV